MVGLPVVHSNHRSFDGRVERLTEREEGFQWWGDE